MNAAEASIGATEKESRNTWLEDKVVLNRAAIYVSAFEYALAQAEVENASPQFALSIPQLHAHSNFRPFCR